MKKVISLLIVTLMILLASCGANQDMNGEQSADAGTKSNEDNEITSIDGKWIEDEDNILTIDGDKVLLEFYYDSYAGSIDGNTMTIKGAGENGSDIVCEYDIIGDKLVVSIDESKNEGDTSKVYSYSRYVPETEEAEETEEETEE